MCSKDDTSVETIGRSITPLAKIMVDPKFIERTANVYRIIQ